jgi:hypothetical protein
LLLFSPLLSFIQGAPSRNVGFPHRAAGFVPAFEKWTTGAFSAGTTVDAKDLLHFITPKARAAFRAWCGVLLYWDKGVF